MNAADMAISNSSTTELEENTMKIETVKTFTLIAAILAGGAALADSPPEPELYRSNEAITSHSFADTNGQNRSVTKVSSGHDHLDRQVIEYANEDRHQRKHENAASNIERGGGNR